MRPARLGPLVFALVVASSELAPAAEPCPPGDWFCDPEPGAPEPGAAPPPPVAPPPPADELPPVEAEREVRIDVENVRPAKPRRRYREWGVNLHATLGLMGGDASGKSDDAGMNGLGGAARFRPLPFVAFEGSVEVVWGTDYRGFDRSETALLANALFFANPKSALQLYGVVGIGLATAAVDGSYVAGSLMRDPHDERYGYFGGQVGAGLEGRITPHFALGGDVLGFLRTRIDGNASEEPEYVEPDTGRTTNGSGGGLLRLGATFYW